jgi:hypothetical protein
MSDKISRYGTYKTKMPVTYKQRFWKKRKDGVKQRYWKKVTRTQKKISTWGRFEIHGKGRDLYKALVVAHRVVPKGFIDVSAEDFLENPYEYGYEGEWIESTIESG